MTNPFELLLHELQEVKKEIKELKTPVIQDRVELVDRPCLQSRLAISTPTIINLEKKGVINRIMVGGKIRYDWNDVVASLEKKKQRRAA